MRRSGDSLEDDVLAWLAAYPQPIDAVVSRSDVVAALPARVAQLDQRRRTVLDLYYGTDGDATQHTLVAIGRQLGVTTERVRTLHRSAVSSMVENIRYQATAKQTPDPDDLRAVLEHAYATKKISKRTYRRMVSYGWDELTALGLTTPAALRTELSQPNTGRLTSLGGVGRVMLQELRSVLSDPIP